jgi:hypothetical protein
MTRLVQSETPTISGRSGTWGHLKFQFPSFLFHIRNPKLKSWIQIHRKASEIKRLTMESALEFEIKYAANGGYDRISFGLV